MTMDRLLRSHFGDLSSNAKHKLLVTPSKHLHVRKSRAVNYRKKPFDVNLRTLAKSEYVHLVHFVLIDDASNSVYGECHPSDELPPTIDFLKRAWAKKWHLHLCGLPRILDIPDTVYSEELADEALSLGIESIGKPESGFKSGIRQLRTWEDNVRATLWRYDTEGPVTAEFLRQISLMLSFNVNVRSDGKYLWEHNIKSLRLLPRNKAIEWLDLVQVPTKDFLALKTLESDNEQNEVNSIRYKGSLTAIQEKVSALAQVSPSLTITEPHRLASYKTELEKLTLGQEQHDVFPLTFTTTPPGKTNSTVILSTFIESLTKGELQTATALLEITGPTFVVDLLRTSHN